LLITNAKRAGFPKASIEAAIARGQGTSPTGIALEYMTVEAMLPPGIGLVIECATDSKMRTLQELRQVFKDCGATLTPTSYMFERKGRVVLKRMKAVSEEEVLERAIEAGALDVEMQDEGRDGEGEIVIFTEPCETTAVTEGLIGSLGVRPIRTEFIWDPRSESKVAVNADGVAEKLGVFMSISLSRCFEWLLTYWYSV
jgi:transcriptional/translational regulatory protein YebC/TACO1